MLKQCYCIVLSLLVTCFSERKAGKGIPTYLTVTSSGKTDMKKFNDVRSQCISLDTYNILAKTTQNLGKDFSNTALLFSLLRNFGLGHS